MNTPTTAWPLYQAKASVLSALLPANKNADNQPTVGLLQELQDKTEVSRLPRVPGTQKSINYTRYDLAVTSKEVGMGRTKEDGKCHCVLSGSHTSMGAQSRWARLMTSLPRTAMPQAAHCLPPDVHSASLGEGQLRASTQGAW